MLESEALQTELSQLQVRYPPGNDLPDLHCPACLATELNVQRKVEIALCNL